MLRVTRSEIGRSAAGICAQDAADRPGTGETPKPGMDPRRAVRRGQGDHERPTLLRASDLPPHPQWVAVGSALHLHSDKTG
jgi:hypothetical protein